MKTSLLATTLFVCLTTTSCTIGKCNLEDQTYFIADEKRLVYNQGDELMFVSNHLDTLYFEVSIEHGFDTNNPDESGYCTHIVWEYEYYKYNLRSIKRMDRREMIDSTYIIMYGSINPRNVSFDWPGFGSHKYNYIQEDYNRIDYQISINGIDFLIKSYYLPDDFISGYDALFHEIYGFLGFVVAKDTFLLREAPFYNEIIEQEIIIKQ